MKKKVIVLMGGFSTERDVSLSSAQGVIKALHALGHTPIPLDLTRDLKTFIQALDTHKPDIVFNALHGKWGEDGCIQGILEMMNIPYSHSGVLGSALSMNKVVARKICSLHGIAIPEGKTEKIKNLKNHVMDPPYVIKPIGEGSSIGVRIILESESSPPPFENGTAEDEVLVERYIPGKEIQVAVLGGKAKGAIEICPHTDFYNYEAKYTQGKATHLMPAPIDPLIYAQALDWAEKAHRILECKGVTRSDFRYDDTRGEPGFLYYLETNPQPGLTPLSLVPEILAHEGMSYHQLIQWMIEDASCPR